MTVEAQAWVQRQANTEPSLANVQLLGPRAQEIVVRIVATGVCHTDLIAPKFARLPAVFGHEGAGIVESVGSSVTRFVPGDRVVLTFGSCGICPNCCGSEPFNCISSSELNFFGQRLDGSTTLDEDGQAVRGAFFQQSSFATRVLATERNAVKVPDDFPLELAAPLGCGIQTGAGAVLNTLAIRPGSSLAVFGCGSVGLSAIMAGRMIHCSPLIAVDVNQQRLQLALELGATHALDAREGDIVRRIRGIAGIGVDYSIDTTAQIQPFKDSIEVLSRGGTCGICAVPDYGKPFEFSPAPILSGRTLKGVLEGSSIPEIFIPELIRLQRAGLLPYERLIRYYDFVDLPAALRDSMSGDVIKAVVRIPEVSANRSPL